MEVSSEKKALTIIPDNISEITVTPTNFSERIRENIATIAKAKLQSSMLLAKNPKAKAAPNAEPADIPIIYESTSGFLNIA